MSGKKRTDESHVQHPLGICRWTMAHSRASLPGVVAGIKSEAESSRVGAVPARQVDDAAPLCMDAEAFEFEVDSDVTDGEVADVEMGAGSEQPTVEMEGGAGVDCSSSAHWPRGKKRRVSIVDVDDDVIDTCLDIPPEIVSLLDMPDNMLPPGQMQAVIGWRKKLHDLRQVRPYQAMVPHQRICGNSKTRREHIGRSSLSNRALNSMTVGSMPASKVVHCLEALGS